MKKIVLSVMTMGAIFFGTQNIQAQEENEVAVETEMSLQQEEYSEVEVTALPQTVKDAITTDYSEATPMQAWVKTKDEKQIYKIDLDVEGETEQVFIDQDGNWLKDDEGDDQK